jgi:hypothetical protein
LVEVVPLPLRKSKEIVAASAVPAAAIARALAKNTDGRRMLLVLGRTAPAERRFGWGVSRSSRDHGDVWTLSKLCASCETAFKSLF